MVWGLEHCHSERQTAQKEKLRNARRWVMGLKLCSSCLEPHVHFYPGVECTRYPLLPWGRSTECDQKGRCAHHWVSERNQFSSRELQASLDLGVTCSFPWGQAQGGAWATCVEREGKNLLRLTGFMP